MKFSTFGKKFTTSSPILDLMNDLGNALKSDKPINMLGGGNPAQIPAVDEVFLKSYQQLYKNQNTEASKQPAIESMGNYSNPQGDANFIAALVDFLNKHYANTWKTTITTDNVALTNGSQNAFFYLFNLFSGKFEDGSIKKILLPLAPEYIGYNDVHVDADAKEPFFVSIKPIIEKTTYANDQGIQAEGFFKYRVDFDALENNADLLAGNIGAICCSRPTNPTGNVLTDVEMQRLDALAKKHDIPLIIDNAYGMPFPNILFSEATLNWNENSILCFSLSKIGLPGLRTGIVVAHPDVINAISALNAVVNLSPTRFGASIATPLLKDDTLKTLSEDHIKPYYYQKANTAIHFLKKELGNYPLHIHKPEGAMFLWLWFEGLPITTKALYQSLKDAGTLVIPSEHFFVGQDIGNFNHAHECIRMSVAQEDDILEKGIAEIGKQVRKLYDQQ